VVGLQGQGIDQALLSLVAGAMAHAERAKGGPGLRCAGEAVRGALVRLSLEGGMERSRSQACTQPQLPPQPGHLPALCLRPPPAAGAAPRRAPAPRLPHTPEPDAPASGQLPPPRRPRRPPQQAALRAAGLPPGPACKA
jgi:hypothetical protein